MMNSPCTALAKARGPGELLPGHDRPRLTQMTAGLKQWLHYELKGFISCTGQSRAPSLRNPAGPREGCAAGRHTQHFGHLVPRHCAPQLPPSNRRLQYRQAVYPHAQDRAQCAASLIYPTPDTTKPPTDEQEQNPNCRQINESITRNANK